MIKFFENGKDILYCFVDNTRSYDSAWAREIIKNISDYTISNLHHKGLSLVQSENEDEMLYYAASQGYRHALVFTTGTEFINGDSYFTLITELSSTDYFIYGHILDRNEAYYELHHQCYIINLEKYKDFGYPEVGKQTLGSKHTQDIPWRSTQNYHDDYTPVIVSGGDDSKEYNHKCHGWNILSIAFDKDEEVLVFNPDIRNNKRHFYPESPQDFYQQLSWAYHRLNYCQKDFVHTSNTEVTHLPIKLYDQIVTPASGVWFGSYLTPDATVIMYDYNQASLNYWKEHAPAIMNVRYKFVLCDLLGNDNLAEHILPNVPNTLVHLSNIFNYEGTTFFYSMAYRKYKESELLEAIEAVCPTAEVYFNLEASIFDTVPTWHINS
jgi:hypothetical protein